MYYICRIFSNLALEFVTVLTNYYLQVSAIHFYLYKMNISTDNKYY
jgi:hypothetical protein